MSTKYQIAGILLAGTLFTISLVFNTLIPAKGDPSFLVGFVCLLFGFSYLAWYANPLILLSVILIALRSRWAVATSALALALAFSALSIETVPYNEGGDDAEVVGYGLGFFLWLASMLTLLLSALWVGFHRPSRPPHGDPTASPAVSP